MISEYELLLMGFLAFGGLIAFLPVVFLEKMKILGILTMIGTLLLIILCSTIFYLIFTDATVIEILTLKANSILLPKRIFTISYTMILVFVAILPIALIRNRFKRRNGTA